MQRRRAQSPAATPKASNSATSASSTRSSNGRTTSSSSGRSTRALSPANSSSSTSSNNHNKQAASAPTSYAILPPWLVYTICLAFLAAGWLQHYYEESRSLDPLTGRNIKHHVGSSNSSSNRQTRIATQLTKEQDAQLEYHNHENEDGTRYHMVFSTDCSAYQHWQSFLVFYTALKVRQPGHVTRIASGCDDTEKAAIQEWFQNDVAYMSSRFHLELTPKFSQVLNENGESIGDYKFFNKPFGLKYWMENSKELNFDGQHFPDTVGTNDVVILIDPDMALLRPITGDFSNERETLIGPKRQQHKIADKVSPGKPFAQGYGFGAQWSRLDLEKIAGKGTPAAAVSAEDCRLYYPAGPPYIATVNDMHAIAVHWAKFVPGVYEQYPHLLAEMFAFSIAAAHLKLPFQLVDSLMVSEISASGEGWAFVDEIPASKMCGFCLNEQDHSKHALPSVLHMCQRYIVGEDWFFTKRKVPSDIYNCETPLFVEPPDDLAVKYDYKQGPGGKRVPLEPAEVKRESFAICYIYGLLNEAASFYKLKKCPANKVNLEKTRSLVDYLAHQKTSRQ